MKINSVLFRSNFGSSDKAQFQSISAVSSPSSSSSRIGRVVPWCNAGRVGQAKSNGEQLQFYYTINNGPTEIQEPAECCRPPVPGDLYFHQKGQLRKSLKKKNCQVFWFTKECRWENITDAYYAWDREEIFHPLNSGYVLNVKEKQDFKPSYVTPTTWRGYKTAHLKKNDLVMDSE